MLNITKYYHDDLVMKTKNLTEEEILSNSIQDFIDEMINTCIHVNGLGLAANQVGNCISIFVYYDNSDDMYKVLINPEIIDQKGKFTRLEGCLSLESRYFIKRAKKITIKGLDRDAKPVQFTTKSKHLARILQHEIDHLNGILISERIK